MTIAKGQPWGRPGRLPDGAPVAASDAELRELVVRHRVGPTPLPLAVGLTGGALWRTLGGPGAVGRLHRDDAMWLPIDVGRASLDGATTWFVASVVARTWNWTRAFVAMNGDWVGRYQFGPRAHPNDGLLDTYAAQLRWQDIAKVARRARNGAHLPHPGITERRIRTGRITFERPRRVWIDGERWATRVRAMELWVEPDSLSVVL